MGQRTVSIPIPQINPPHFRFDKGGKKVGQGKGEPGDIIGQGEQEGMGPAGEGRGQHIQEVEFTLDELAALLGEELALPNIEPKSRNNVQGGSIRYSGMRRVGPEGLRYFKRTYQEALKRQIMSGIYDPDDPVVIPIREDTRYRSWKEIPKPDSNAVIFYIMDVSGSMTTGKKELVRRTAFWIDTWLRAQYHNIRVHYIIHDWEAAEASEEIFYTIREAGGTKISSSYRLLLKLIRKNYSPDDWNIYAFQFSDGDNHEPDNEDALRLLVRDILPLVNQFAYAQILMGAAWSEQFYSVVKSIEHEKLITWNISHESSILPAIKAFLGRGR
jgi:hypothetical protein